MISERVYLILFSNVCFVIIVEESRTAQNTAVLDDFSGLVCDAEETYRDIQEDLVECQTELKEQAAEMERMVSVRNTRLSNLRQGKTRY